MASGKKGSLALRVIAVCAVLIVFSAGAYVLASSTRGGAPASAATTTTSQVTASAAAAAATPATPATNPTAPTTTTVKDANATATTTTFAAPAAAQPVAHNAVPFDFDTGSPAVAAGRGTPIDQTSGGITASFSSPSDPAAFSLQNQGTTSYALSQFSGNYLVGKDGAGDYLYIAFDKPVTGINVTFATADPAPSGGAGTASMVKMTLYRDSVFAGSVGGQGTFSGDTFPQGKMSYIGRQINMVRIAFPYQPSTFFLVDNIVVIPAVQ
jgi:hypothetical protein